MTTAYTSLLGLALPVTGELSGTWGDTVNDYITQYLDASVAGTQTISGSQTAVTLSKTTNASLSQAGSGATGSSQYNVINCTGNPASMLTVTVPAASKTYVVVNATSTNQDVKIVGAGPTTGVTLVAGERAIIAWNGSDFIKVATSTVDGVSTIAFGTTGLTPSTATSGAVTVAGTLVAANGGTGQSSYTTGDLLYATGSTALSKLGIGTNGQILTSTGTAPQWSAPAALTKTDDTNVTLTLGGSASTALLNAASITAGWTGQLSVARGGTNATATPTAGAVAYGTGTAYAFTAAGTSNQVLISNGASAPSWSNLSSLGVTSLSFGTTGLTPSTATQGAITVAGTLATTNGGTGLTSFTANGVVYASSTSALTTGSALQFDGSRLGVGISPDTGLVTNTKQLVLNNFSGEGVGINFSRPTDSTEVNAIGTASSFWELGLFGREGIVFATGGGSTYSATTEQMRLTSTGLGIGTSNPAYKLDVVGTGSIISATRSDTNRADIIVTNSGGTVSFGINNSTGSWLTDGLGYYGYILGPSSASYGLQFGVGASNTAAVTIAPSGNVGIGTSSPGAKLESFVTSTTTPALRLRYNSTSYYADHLMDGNGNYVIQSPTANGVTSGNLRLRAGALFSVSVNNNAVTSADLTLDSSGNLGLGVTPSAWGGAGKVIQFGNGLASIGTQNSGDANFIHNAYESPAGTFKYAATGGAPRYQLNINSNEHRWYTAPAWNGTGSDTISFTQAMTLDASGNLGVGSTSPTGARCVITTVGADATSEIALSLNHGDGSLSLNQEVRLNFGQEMAHQMDLHKLQPPTQGAFDGDLRFRTNTGGTITERARISSDGTFRVKGAGTAGSTDAVQFAGLAPASSLTLDGSGRLLVGLTSSKNNDCLFQVEGGLTNGGQIYLGNSYTLETSSVIYGQVNFVSNVGSVASTVASILATNDGNHTSSTNKPTCLTFYTTPSGSATRAERGRFSADGTFRVKGAGTAGSTDAVQFAGSAPASSLTLDASGNLLLNTTSNSGGHRLVVSQTNASGVAAIHLPVDESTILGPTANTNITMGSNLYVRASSVLGFSTNNTERARITSGGYFKASNDGTYLGSTGGYHELRSNTDNNNAVIISSNATNGTQYGLSIRTTNDQNDATRDFLECQGGGVLRAQFRTNGGLANYSANDVNLSDQRLKTDAQPAGNYLDKICAIPIKTFLYKDQTDTERNLGVMAQDVDAVAPELIDHNGFGETPEGESPYLAVYQTDLQYALMKCIQELKSELDSVKAELATLKGA